MGLLTHGDEPHTAMNIYNATCKMLPTICLLAVACNKEPAQELTEARKESAVKHEDFAQEQAKLDAKQAESRAELARKQALQQSELHESKVASEAKGDEKLAIAQAEFTAERREANGKNNKRIQDAQARATEFQTQAKSLSADKHQKFDVAWNVYTSRRDEALKQSQDSLVVSNTDWAQLKPETEKSIARLEASVTDVHRTL